MTAVDLNFPAVAPLVTLAVTALIVLVLDLTLPTQRARPWWYAVSLGGLVLSWWYVASLWSGSAVEPNASIVGIGSLGRVSNGIAVFGGAYILDRFTLIFNGIVLLTAFLTVLLSFFRKEEDVSGYLALVLWGAMGMMILAGAGNFLTLFLGLEILSLSLYVIVAFGRGEGKSKEAAFKYLVLGSVASAVMLYGFAFLYGQTGTMALAGLAAGWSAGSTVLMKVGVGLVLLALAFKLALVPFHVWAPDVYEGASAPVTAFMSVGTKAAAFAALVRFLVAALPDQGPNLVLPIWILAVLSMVVGSLGACIQTNIKRLLAYSGVAHAGYLMMALLGMTNQGLSAGVFYMGAYLFMNMGAFAVIIWLGKGEREGETLQDLAGLFYRRPVLAGALTLFMLSLAGFPPAAGFPGKLFLMFSALAGGTGAPAAWLVGTLVATSGISAYAYLRVVTAMLRRREQVAVAYGVAEAAVAASGATEESEPAGDEIGFSWSLALVVAISVFGTIYLGVLPQSVLALADQLLPLP